MSSSKWAHVYNHQTLKTAVVGVSDLLGFDAENYSKDNERNRGKKVYKCNIEGANVKVQVLKLGGKETNIFSQVFNTHIMFPVIIFHGYNYMLFAENFKVIVWLLYGYVHAYILHA